MSQNVRIILNDETEYEYKDVIVSDDKYKITIRSKENGLLLATINKGDMKQLFTYEQEWDN